MDKFKKVQTGDSLKIPADAYNAFIDAAADFRNRTAKFNQQSKSSFIDSNIVLIKNETGQDCDRFNIVGLGEPIISPDENLREFKKRVMFRGVVPNEELHGSKFAVLQEPVKAGHIARAIVFGNSIAKLQIENTEQKIKFAKLESGNSATLIPENSGPIKILWHEQKSGIVWAVVCINNIVQSDSFGFGKPALGEVDSTVKPDILLTITDDSGNPILDDAGLEQIVKVYRNSTGKALFTNFDSDTIFRFVKFSKPDSNDYVGCIFSRTEPFKFDKSRHPAGTFVINPGSLLAKSIDATGDPANKKHVHIIGRTFIDTAGGDKGFAPWAVIDPTKLGLDNFTVKTDGNDTKPGFLNDKIFVLPAAGHNWLAKSVTPGGANDNKLLLEHNDWDEVNAVDSAPLPGNLAAGNGAEIVGTKPVAQPYIEYQEFCDRVDDKRHSEVLPELDANSQPIKKYVKLPCKVFVDADDTTPGNLDDEIVTDDWLEKSVTPGGANDNKLLLEHKNWNADKTIDTASSLITLENHGGGCSLDIAQPLPGYAWINIETWQHMRDEKGHCQLLPRQPGNVPLEEIYLKWLALPQGSQPGELLKWDGQNGS